MKSLFILPISFDLISCQGTITYYGQYGKLLKDLHSLRLYKTSNIDDNEASLNGRKDKNKDKNKDKVKDKDKTKVKDKDKNKVKNGDKNKDENAGSSKFNIYVKLEAVKRIYIDFDWGKEKAKNKDKDKNENAGSFKLNIDAKSERGKNFHITAD